MKDIICLVADKNMEAVVGELLQRHRSLGTRNIQYEILIHSGRDPGCFFEGVDFIKVLRDKYSHAIIMLDFAWDGAPAANAESLQRMLADQIREAGLDDWAEPIVIDPELEVWIFSDSPHVERCLGWGDQALNLRSWLEARNLWAAGLAKPGDPKAAVEEVLYHVRLARSSSIYRDLARSVSLDRCIDPSFLRFKTLIQNWL